MAPRRRQRKNEKLPPYVYLKKGRYVIVRYDPETRKQTERRLCAGDAPLADVWAAYQAQQEKAGTFSWLSDLYQQSEAYKTKSRSTQRAYTAASRIICGTKTRDGRLLGEIPLSSWTQPVIRKYLDKRAAEGAAVAGNREKAYISLVFSWGVERGHASLNPAKGVKRNPERHRTRYVTDAEYQESLKLAARYPYMPPIMELAYLLRARLSEVLDLTRDDLLEEGVLLHRRKGSRDAVTRWSPRLRSAIAACRVTVTNRFNPHLLQSKDGERLRESTVQTAWQRIMRQWTGERFTIHDLKAKGITDTEGDKQSAGGHVDPKMVRVYDRKPLDVDPTK